MSEVYVGSSLANQSTYVDFECVLRSPPNMVLFAQERRWHCRKLTLMDITDKICDGLQPRAAQGKYHGVLLISEGLIESIPEMYAFIQKTPKYISHHYVELQGFEIMHRAHA